MTWSCSIKKSVKWHRFLKIITRSSCDKNILMPGTDTRKGSCLLFLSMSLTWSLCGYRNIRPYVTFDLGNIILVAFSIMLLECCVCEHISVHSVVTLRNNCGFLFFIYVFPKAHMAFNSHKIDWTRNESYNVKHFKFNTFVSTHKLNLNTSLIAGI